MDCFNITRHYYSAWLGIDLSLIKENEIRFIYSSERNKTQAGYGTPFDLMIYKEEYKTVISYGDKAQKNIAQLKSQIHSNSSINEICLSLKNVYKAYSSHNIKFVFDKLPQFETSAVTLTERGFPLYLDFFKTIHPNIRNYEWLKEYYLDHIEKRFFCASFHDGRIVSCTDAPGMPFMENEAQEIGINTIPQYRGQGFAKNACLLATQNIIKSGECPQWSTAENNMASQKLAYSIGFKKLADFITVTL